MGKAPLIIQYLHDHSRLVCDRLNEKDGPGTWKIIPISDEQRKNIIFYYGTGESIQNFFMNESNQIPDKKIVSSPHFDMPEINMKSITKRENTHDITSKNNRKNRLTLRRNHQFTEKPKIGIFSHGIQSQRVLIPPDCDRIQAQISNSTSSIYLNSNNNSSSDFEGDLFNEPEDLSMAQFHHDQDLNREYDWFDNTANWTKSQLFHLNSPKVYQPSRFNSQK